MTAVEISAEVLAIIIIVVYCEIGMRVTMLVIPGTDNDLLFAVSVLLWPVTLAVGIIYKLGKVIAKKLETILIRRNSSV